MTQPLSRTVRWMIAASAASFVFAFAMRPNAVLAAPANQLQAVSNTQLIEAVQVLRSIKRSLEAADHDYGGHRAAAVRDIGAADHQLFEALNYVPQGKAAPQHQ